MKPKPSSRARRRKKPEKTPPASRLGTGWKVDRLPPRAQAAVFRGLAGGHSLARIVAAVRKAGGSISRRALLCFRQRGWNNERYRLKRARANLEVLKEALQLDPSSTTAQVAEELLYTMVCQKLEGLEPPPDFSLLREAREQKKARARSGATAAAPPAPLSEEELDRKIRQIYGLPQLPEETPDPDAENSQT